MKTWAATRCSGVLPSGCRMDQSLTPQILSTLERLAEAGFELLPMAEIGTHYVVARDGYVAMVDRREDGSFGSSGNPGKIGPRGFALFLRRGGRTVFASKGHEEEASAEVAAAVQAFAADLKRAIDG